MKKSSVFKMYNANKHYLNLKLCIISIMLLIFSSSYAQTTVNSLSDLLPYLDDDNADVVLTAGDYYVTADDVSDETIGEYWEGSTYLGNSFNVFLFQGDNSTYDFTGVTIYIETETAQSVGSVDFYEVRIIGSNNTISNLTVVDDGDEDDAPTSRATNVVLDGANNVIDGCHFTIKGSSPYGYGDIFGKGSSYVISHNKRSACLIRGNSNSVLNSTFICRSYGHGIFFQGANDPYVEGCYVEGELNTTDNVLAEEGTGSSADNVDFETIFGFNLNDIVGNYYFSCQEDGIRSYNAGETVIDGVEYDRGVTNATVINSTVVKMRSGITIGWASGTKYVENCYAYACETGYWVGSDTEVVDCYGDASIGALLSEDASRSDATIELTLVDNYITPLDGEVTDLYYAGSGHEVTIHDGTSSFDSDIEFVIGGERLAHRYMTGNDSTNEPLSFDASDITFTNNTSYPIYVGENASDIIITTCGTVSDDGSGTSVSYTTDCPSASGTNIALAGTASQSSTAYSGEASRAIDGDTNGDWSGGSVTHTDSETGAWWEVTFDDANIGVIKIYNRTGSTYSSRLTDFTVSVINSDETTVYSQTIIGYPDPSISIYAGGVTGSTVRVVLNSTNPLSLAEVEVYESYSGTENGQYMLAKYNATDYAIDGGSGAIEGTSIELYSYVEHDNLTWTEIELSNGYFMYQKYNTDVCFDSDDDVSDGSDVYLSTCNESDENQQWEKIEASTGVYRLQKQGTTYSLDGGNDGADNQNVYLWTSSSTNENQQWRFDDVTSLKSASVLTEVESSSEISIYPNPVHNKLTITNSEGAILEIFNAMGSLILTEKVASMEETINMSDFAIGMYIIKTSKQGEVQIQKVLKQ